MLGKALLWRIHFTLYTWVWFTLFTQLYMDWFPSDYCLLQNLNAIYKNFFFTSLYRLRKRKPPENWMSRTWRNTTMIYRAFEIPHCIASSITYCSVWCNCLDWHNGILTILFPCISISPRFALHSVFFFVVCIFLIVCSFYAIISSVNLLPDFVWPFCCSVALAAWAPVIQISSDNTQPLCFIPPLAHFLSPHCSILESVSSFTERFIFKCDKISEKRHSGE